MTGLDDRARYMTVYAAPHSPHWCSLFDLLAVLMNRSSGKLLGSFYQTIQTSKNYVAYLPRTFRIHSLVRSWFTIKV